MGTYDTENHAGEISSVPRIPDDLQTWFGYDQYPQYLAVSNGVFSGESFYNAQPSLTNWPGKADHVFLDLSVRRKN